MLKYCYFSNFSRGHLLPVLYAYDIMADHYGYYLYAFMYKYETNSSIKNVGTYDNLHKQLQNRSKSHPVLESTYCFHCSDIFLGSLHDRNTDHYNRSGK